MPIGEAVPAKTTNHATVGSPVFRPRQASQPLPGFQL